MAESSAGGFTFEFELDRRTGGTCNNLWIEIVLLIWNRSDLTFLLTYVVVW